MSLKMVFLIGTLVLAGIVADGGIIAAKVHQKKPHGTNLRLYLPAVLVPVGMKIAPGEPLRRAASEVKEFLPAMRVAAEELSKCPDGRLVEVSSPREQVRIVKSGGSLVVDVSSAQEEVHVSLPLKMVGKVFRELEARAPPAAEGSATPRD